MHTDWLLALLGNQHLSPSGAWAQIERFGPLLLTLASLQGVTHHRQSSSLLALIAEREKSTSFWSTEMKTEEMIQRILPSAK